ncbi:MAG: DUF294 nucleotidyltransferase-like domain-containing protein [Hyphomicrobiaceae bacterium]
MTKNFASTPLNAVEAVALDLETTGLEGDTARAVQIGAVGVSWGKPDPDATFSRIVNPGVEVPAQATAVHGLDSAALASAPAVASVLPDLEAFIAGRVLLGHNIGYDLEVLRHEYELAGRRLPQLVALDVQVLARIVTPTLAHDGLPQLCEWLDLKCEKLHSALGDALATANVFAALVPRLRERGIRTIAEAQAASRALQPTAFTTAIDEDQTGATIDGLGESIRSIDGYPYRHRVSEVMSKPPLVVTADGTVGAALDVMMRAGTSSVFVSEAGRTTGIITERDMLRAIADRGADALARPVSEIASRPLVTVDEDAFLYRALSLIDRKRIRHLAVTDATGNVVGALTPRNLLAQRASAALVLGDEIDAAANGGELGAAFGRLPRVAQALIDEGVEARRIAAVISAEIAAATRRASELAEASMAADGWGAPPQPYAVFVMGSVGRGESLLAADQDNAIVFSDGEPGGTADRWFEELGTRMAQSLDEAGIPFCKGGVMAKNAQWRHSVAGWRAVIESWVRRQRPEDLLDVDIFFDSMPVHGDRRLADEIRAYAFDLGHRSPDFLNLLTELARKWHPPFNLIGGIKTDDEGRVDLKKGGLMPIFTAARVSAIRHRSLERSTPARLATIVEHGKGSAADVARVVDAHQTLMRAMLCQQLADTAAGIAPSPRVKLDRFDSAARQGLKRAINEVRTAIDLVSEGRL